MYQQTACGIDLTPWGYAPGTSNFYCDVCSAEPYPTGNWPHSGHKHSTRCMHHALEARLQHIRSSESSFDNELEAHLQELADDKHSFSAAVSISTLILAVAIALFASL